MPSALPTILGWKHEMTKCCSKPAKNNTFCTPSSPQMGAYDDLILLKTCKKNTHSALPAVLGWTYHMTRCCSKPIKTTNSTLPAVLEWTHKITQCCSTPVKTTQSALSAILGWKHEMTQCCSKPLKHYQFCTPRSPRKDT